MIPYWSVPQPPLEPPALTRRQERQAELADRLEEVNKEIRQHQYSIDDLKAEAEEIKREMEEG